MELISISAVKCKRNKEDERATFVGDQGNQAKATENAEAAEEAGTDSTSWFSWLPSHCVVS